MSKRKKRGGINMAGIHGPGLPDFLIIGAQKCGTTALRYNLSTHRDIAVHGKEVHFFSEPKNWERGVAWYSQHFQSPERLQGEKSPGYLESKIAAKRIATILPSAKLIVILRDPVTRAYSQWNHMMQNIEQSSRRDWESASFDEAIARASTGTPPFDRLLRKGEYIDQIARYTEYFPPEQIFIGIQERFFRNGAEELARIFDFLGVERLPIEPRNRHVRSYESPMAPHIEAELVRYFEPFNQRLFQFLGETIPEWRRA